MRPVSPASNLWKICRHTTCTNVFQFQELLHDISDGISQITIYIITVIVCWKIIIVQKDSIKFVEIKLRINFSILIFDIEKIIDNSDKKNFRQQVEKVTFSFLSTLRNFWIPSSICFAHFRQRASKLGETWKHRRWNGQVRAASAPGEIVECKSGIKFSNTSVTSPISESSPIFSARLRFCTGEPRPGGRPRVRNADEFANPPIRVKRQTSQFLFPVFPAVIFADPLKNIRVLDVLTAR